LKLGEGLMELKVERIDGDEKFRKVVRRVIDRNKKLLDRLAKK